MDGELSTVAGDDYCYLTTTGRRSGRPHEVEIWFALHERTLYLLAGGRDGSDWVRNAEADPQVAVRVRDRTYAGIARVLRDEGVETTLARGLVFEKYQARYDGSLERWRAASLPVAIDLEEQP